MNYFVSYPRSGRVWSENRLVSLLRTVNSSEFGRATISHLNKLIKNSHAGFHPTGGTKCSATSVKWGLSDNIYVLFREAKASVISHYYYVLNVVEKRNPGFMASVGMPFDRRSFALGPFGIDRFVRYTEHLRQNRSIASKVVPLFYEDAYKLRFIKALSKILHPYITEVSSSDINKVFLNTLGRVNTSSTIHPAVDSRLYSDMQDRLNNLVRLEIYRDRYLSNDLDWEYNVFSTSYKTEQICDLISSIISVINPSIVAEVGTQQGKSSILIAKGMQSGTLSTYDSFKATYVIPPRGETFSSMDLARINLREAEKKRVFSNVDVSIHKGSFDLLLRDHPDGYDALHIDVCNHLDNLKPVFSSVLARARKLVLLEGGVENNWQRKNNFKPYTSLLETPQVKRDWEIITCPFGNHNAITIMIRREVYDGIVK